MALGEAASGLVADEGVVEVGREGEVKEALEDAVDVGGGEQVVAAGDVGDLLGGVIDHDSKMVGGGDVFAGEDDIAEQAGVDGLLAVEEVVECQVAGDVSGGGGIQAPAVRGVGLEEPGALRRGEQATGAGVEGAFGTVWRLGEACDFEFDLLAGAEAGIGGLEVNELVESLGVGGGTRWGVLAQSRAVPSEAEPKEVLLDGGVEFIAKAGRVDILEAQAEQAARSAGKVVGDDGRVGVAKMQGTGRAGSETRDHRSRDGVSRALDGRGCESGGFFIWLAWTSPRRKFPRMLRRMGEEWSMRPIGKVRSCFGEKFAVPRQPGLAVQARAELVLEPWCRSPEAVRGLDGFSHIWLIFVFHEVPAQGWKPTVRPPRLGGNQRVGVFASRSPFRPNPLGLSVVRLEGIREDPLDGPVLMLSGIDLVDGTPVLDVKPYIAYADSLPQAVGSFASEAPARLEVVVADEAQENFGKLDVSDQAVVLEVLSLDPRPAIHPESGRVYGAALCGHNVQFSIQGGICQILAIG